ncbi:MAG: sulfite exporter TauE/SafE family protein [Dehalococcoidales bacterium]
MELTSSIFLFVIFIAVLCQYMSVSIGVGYGTVLTPLLLIIGFLPLQVVPAVLLSQLAGGMIGGLAHYRLGNIRLDFRRDDRLVKGRMRRLGYLPRSIDAKIIFVLATCGVAGVLAGVFLAVNIPQTALEIYIGAMVLAIGLMIVFKRSYKGDLSWKGLLTLGLLGAFNKGVSGGGYVPLVTGGQIISGREVRSSIGSTTVAVSIVCAVGFLGYFLVRGDIFWMLVLATCIGSIVAAPFAALSVKKVNPEKLRFAIGLTTIVLGAVTLAKTFIS